MTEEIKCNFQQNYNIYGLDDKPCCYLFHKYCNEVDDCEHKQLQRLKQENETIREHCKQVDETNKILYKEKCDLIQENEKLKEDIQAQKGLITVGGKQQYELTLAYDKYKTALEEIRNNLKDICDRECNFHWCKGSCPDSDCDYYTNINKINEVMNDRL